MVRSVSGLKKKKSVSGLIFQELIIHEESLSLHLTVELKINN